LFNAAPARVNTSPGIESMVTCVTRPGEPELRAAYAAGAPSAVGRRLITADGSGYVIRRSESAVRMLASMGLEIVANQPFLGRGVCWEDTAGVVGQCELPPSEMRALVRAPGLQRDADLCIWLIERGQLTLEQNNGIHAEFGAGSLLLCDLAHAMRGRWHRSRLAYIRPSREWLMQVLGRTPAARGRMVETIEHLGLAPFLGSQLGMLASHGAVLVRADLETVLGGIFQTAEVLLKSAFQPAPETGAAAGPERLQAVNRFIQRNLHRHDLSVADIALGTNISRAQLYRLFAAQDKSVHSTLREARLAKSLSYLQQPESSRLSIGAIAHASGFSDQAAFGKLFRQRFGMTPREARPREADAD
jgi:AraC-like DNA-binding protein